MKTALSTACFFPEEPEESLLRVAPLGFSFAEVFVNTESETKPDYFKELKKRADDTGVKIIAVHTPYGYAEPYFFFSPYIRRRLESLDKYERIFESMNIFEGAVFNFHGGFLKTDGALPLGIEYYIKLKERAEKYGVIFCQENVNRYTFSTPDNIAELKKSCPDCHFTIDIKQANRAGFVPGEILGTMSGNVKHFHINDFCAEDDCRLPGCGSFDLAPFCESLTKSGFDGYAVIEVYRKSFGTPDELSAARRLTEVL